MKEWYPIYTQISKEFFVKKEIERLGFDTYLPVTKKTIKHARKISQISKPLFSRYIFVAIDKQVDNWFFLNNMHGVVYFLKNNNKILPIKKKIINYLKSLEKQKGYINIFEIFKLKKGNIIKVKEGVFKGFLGKFNKYRKDNKFNLFVNFFNREINITLPSSFFEPVI